MAANIPMVSSIVAGLMSQADKIKLDALPASITGSDPLSSSIQRSHQLSASYFSMSSGSVNILSASRITVYDLIVQNSNISGSGGGNVSASIVQAHQLSASYFSMSSGLINNLSATSISVGNLAATSLSITGTVNFTKIIQLQVTDPDFAITTGDGKCYFLVPSQLDGLTLSSAHAGLVSGSTSGTPTIQIRNVTAGVDMLSTAITIDIGDNPATSYTAATPPVIDSANDDVSTGDILAVDIDTAGTGAKGLFVVLVFNNTTLNEFSDLTASTIQTHNLSASYFEFISGNVRTLTGTGLQTTWSSASSGSIHVQTASYLTGTEFQARSGSFSIVNSHIMTATNFTASSGSVHVLTGAYMSGNTLTVQDLVVINSNITASAVLLSASTVRAHNLSASYFEFISGNVRTLTGTGLQTTWFSASSGSVHVETASYLTGTEFRARSGSFSIVNSHIMTATNFTASSGSVHVLTGAYMSGNTLTVQDLVVINSNITASAVLLSASTVRAHNLSASYFEFISGNVRTLTGTGLRTTWFSASSGSVHVLTGAYVSGTEFRARSGSFSIVNSHIMTATNFTASSGSVHVLTGAYMSGNTLTVQDLVVINSNITASAVLLSASTVRAHNLSASYFEFISGNVRTLTGTGLQTTWFSASSGTVHVETASYLTGTEFRARSGSFSIAVSHILTGTNFTASSGSVHVLTGAYMSGNTLTVQDLVVINSNITASAVLLSASTVRAHNLSASYFEFISGNVRTLTGTGISGSSGTYHVVTASYLTGTEFKARTGSFSIINSHIMTATNFTASSGSVHVLTGAYMSGNTLTVQDLVVINSNITASSVLLSASIVRAHNLSASYFEFISGNIRTLTGTGLQTTWFSASSGTVHVETASYLTGTEFKARTGSFSIVNSHIMTATNFTASSGSVHVLTGAYMSGNTLTVQDLVVINSNITASAVLLSASTVRAHNLSASYFEFISGNVRTLTGTGIGATQMSGGTGTYHVLTASYLTGTEFRTYNLSASYFQFISGNVRTLTGTGLQTTWFSASSGSVHVETASYLTGTEFRARSGSFSIAVSHIMTATNFTASSGSVHVLTGAYMSGNTLTVQDLVVINSNITASAVLLSASTVRAHNLSASYFEFISGNVRTLTGTGIGATQMSGGTGTYHVLTASYINISLLTGTDISGSSGTFHVLTGAYMSATRLTVTDLVVINTNMTGGATDPLSSSVVRAHNLSASYFEFISGNIRTLTGTGIGATQMSGGTGTYHVLTGTYINASLITGTGISGSSGTFHVATASYLSATRLTVTDLVVINTNMTGGATDPLSSSVVRAHNLSASYFEFISGNVRTLTGTGISGSSGTFHVLTSSYLKNFADMVTKNLLADDGIVNNTLFATLLLASSMTASVAIQAHNLSASYFKFISGNVRTLTGTGIGATQMSGGTGTYHVLTGTYINASHITGTGISGSSGTFHVATASYLSATRLTVTDLVVINTNMTGGATDPLSSSIVRTHQLSASYFSMSSGSINNLSATSISVGNLVASQLNITGTTDTTKIIQLQVTDPDFAITTGDGKCYFLVPSQLNGYNLSAAHAGLVSGSTSGTPTIQIRNVTDAVDMLSTAITIDIGDNPATSYTAATPPVVNSATDDVSTGDILAVDIDTAGTGAKGLFVVLTFDSALVSIPILSASTIQTHNLSASYFEFISGNVRTLTGTTSLTSPRGVFTDLVVVNTNITSSIPDPLSSSVIRANNLSASYFEFISGNVRTLTGTGIQTIWLSASSGSVHVQTASYLTGTEFRIHNLSASYYQFISGNVQKLTASYFSATRTEIPRIVQLQVSDPNGSAITTGDGKAYFMIPSELSNWNLVGCAAGAITGSTSGTPTVQIRNVTAGVDMLSTAITIDIGDNPATSYTAATPPVINAANDDVQTGEMIAVDVDTAGTGVKGLIVTMVFKDSVF